MVDRILALLLSLPGLLLALSLHEFAHGYAAYKMGDSTAKLDGRLSINPLHHLDPIGALCLLLFRFGWAKPVPVNPYNFRNHKAGIIVVSLAGVVMNFLVALVFAFIQVIMLRYLPLNNLTQFLRDIVTYTISMNIGLMCFNLIPIPPLDGSKVLLEFLPYRFRQAFYNLERYASIILMVALLTNALSPVLTRMYGFVYNIIYSVVLGLIF